MIQPMEGTILKGIGGFYTVLSGGQQYVCRARGRFRRQGLTPSVGDRVRFHPPQQEKEGAIEEVLPRKNLLVRPPVANITRLVVTLSIDNPQPDLLLADRLILDAGRMDISVLVCLNKMDLAPRLPQELQEYGQGYDTVAVSGKTGEGIERFKGMLAGEVACFAGQSGVGKSSLLNAIDGGKRPVGTLTRIERGRHTTRHAELIPLDQGGMVVDTPGFSILETEARPPEELVEHYPEFVPFAGGCRFPGCQHDREPGCAVRRAVESGQAPPGRYERYRVLLEEQREKWRNRYV